MTSIMYFDHNFLSTFLTPWILFLTFLVNLPLCLTLSLEPPWQTFSLSTNINPFNYTCTHILCNWALLEWRFSLFVNSIYLSSMQHRHVCTVHALYFKEFVFKILFIKEYIIKLLRLFCICMYLISSRLQS